MDRRKLLKTFLASLFILLPIGAYAEEPALPVFSVCNIDETTASPNQTFSKIIVKVCDLDDSGKYVYWGADIGIFKKPDAPALPDGDWTSLYIERVKAVKTDPAKLVTDGYEQIKIINFGDISKYQPGKVYSLGYRILYQPIGAETNPIVKTEWKKVKDEAGKDLYFKSVPALDVKLTDLVTGVNKWLVGKDPATIKKYNWYSPSSQVVCKAVIKPAEGKIFDSYTVTMDANVSVNNPLANNDKIEVADLRIVKVDIGGVEKIRTETPTGSLKSSTDKLTYTVNLTEAEKGKEVVIYYKYFFKKKDKNKLTGDSLRFNNVVTAVPKIGGTAQGETSISNEIQIRDIKIDYR